MTGETRVDAGDLDACRITMIGSRSAMGGFLYSPRKNTRIQFDKQNAFLL